MKTIIDALLEISLYAAAIAAAILLFRRLFQKSISPSLQYLVWMLLIARLLLPVTIESGFHVESLFPAPVQTPATVSQIQPASAPRETVGDTGAMLTDDATTVPATPEIPSARLPRFNPYALAMGVWLGGAALVALWLLVVKLRFFRRMERCRIETPSEAEALYENCRAEAGVKRKPPLWVVDAAISPGVALFGGPVLLIPASMLETPSALRFAFLHELTHHKRGDHLVNALLNLLRAVYWFHPAVHYAFSQMRADMEIACDHGVTRVLEPGEKKGYLTAILELFSYELHPQLGMAQFGTRYMARRRMKGAFMKEKTSVFSKLAAAFMCVLLAAGCFTTACQSAPPMEAEKSPAAAQTVPSPTPQEGEDIYLPFSVPTGELSELRGYAMISFRSGGQDEALASDIQKALELLNAGGGTVLQPGEAWSFLTFFDALYKAQGADGWIAAPGIENGSDMENGACYVSTAVYGAALNAGLTVTERHRHAWPQNYAKPGLDASIIYGSHDLKIKNSTDAPVLISGGIGELENGLRPLSIQVWGAPLKVGEEHALRSETIATETAGETTYQDDPTLPLGMWKWAVAPRDGSMVEVYRDTYQNGVLTQSELLYTDFYRAEAGVKLVGTKTPYLIADRTDAELKALAKTLYEAYRFDSRGHTFDEINAHYSKLFSLLEIGFGGMMSDDIGTVVFTIGVPMKEFRLEKCWPYAAVIFALDPGAVQMSIGRIDYSQAPGTMLEGIRRGDVEAYYGKTLTQPLLDYAVSEEELYKLLKAAARF
ncbi:MAG: M56 family metallopeptidase [Clostridiaceae bacterium]